MSVIVPSCSIYRDKGKGNIELLWSVMLIDQLGSRVVYLFIYVMSTLIMSFINLSYFLLKGCSEKPVQCFFRQQ